MVGLQNGQIIVIGYSVRQIQSTPTMSATLPMPPTDADVPNQEIPPATQSS